MNEIGNDKEVVRIKESVDISQFAWFQGLHDQQTNQPTDGHDLLWMRKDAHKKK